MAKRKKVNVGAKLGFRSGLEETVYKQIAKQGITPEYESFKIPYVIPASNHTYTPDFQLPNGIIERNSSISDKWMTIEVKEKDDSLRARVEMRDELSVSFKNVSQGLFKKKKSVVEVTNANPYVKIEGLRSFEIPQKKSNLKFWVGVGIGAGAGYLLFK